MAGNSIFSHEQENNIDSPLGNWHQELLDKQAEEKRKKDTIQIFSIKVDEGKSIDGLIKQFDVIVELSSSPVNHKVEIEIDGKVFVAGQDFSSINTLGRFFYATVNINFSTVARYNEVYQLTAKLIDLSTNSLINTKSINVKVGSDGRADATNEKIEDNVKKDILLTQIDVDFFFKNYALQFEEITENQENSLIKVFNGIEKYYSKEKKQIDKNQLAYILATVKHETGSTFNPVEEAYWLKWKTRKKYFEEMYDPVLGKNEKRRKMALDNGNSETGDGVKYFGRGYVQITWKNNYQRMKDKFEVDLINYPGLALEHELAMSILIYGSEMGVFTGLKLNKYINSKKTDYYNARRVINGIDKATTIKNYAIKIEKCLQINEN